MKQQNKLSSDNKYINVIKRYHFSLLFLVIAGIIGLILSSSYVAIQQTARREFNYNLLNQAHTLADSWQAGTDIPIELGKTSELRGRYTAFKAFYDQNANIIASDVSLDGQTLIAPSGVIKSARIDHDNTVTWRPVRGIRLATAVVKSNNGYVMTAQSLADTETTAQNNLYIFGISYIICLVLVAIGLGWLAKSSFQA